MDLSDALDVVELESPGALSDALFNEFIHRLMRAATAAVSGTGNRMTSTGTAMETSLTRYSIQGASEGLPDLLVGRVDEDVRLWVVVKAGDDPGGTDVWVTANELARSGIGSRERFPWSAAIAAEPDFGHEVLRLSEPISISGQRIRSLDRLVSEIVPGPHPTMSGGGTIKSYVPVAVDGTSEGYAWQGAAETVAARALSELCAVLTVATPALWTVRDGLAPYPSDERYAAWQPPVSPFGAIVDPTYADLDVPDWLSQAMDNVTNRRLRAAVLMFQEGCLLSPVHPSLALISFTSVVEAVFNGGEGLERCSACRSVTGSTKRFKDAVASVMPQEVAELLSSAYGQRSRTVHDGRLHGEEVHRGAAVVTQAFGRDPTTDFRWLTLRYTRDAARALLLERLRTSQ